MDFVGRENHQLREVFWWKSHYLLNFIHARWLVFGFLGDFDFLEVLGVFGQVFLMYLLKIKKNTHILKGVFLRQFPPFVFFALTTTCLPP